MPGPAVYAPHTYQPIPVPSTSVPIESRFSGGHAPRRSESPQYYRSPRAPSPMSARYATAQQSGWHRDPLITLPPLLPSSSYSTRRAHSPSPYMPSRRAHGPARPISPRPTSISPESRFAYIAESTGRPSMSLPRPFTMQPSLQWNQASFRPVPRPSSSPWSLIDSSSTIERSTPSATARHERTVGDSITDPSEAHRRPERTTSPLRSSSHFMPQSSSVTPSRPGRYDPVRATFITRSTPTLPRVMSPARQGGEDNEREIHDNRKSHTAPSENR